MIWKEFSSRIDNFGEQTLLVIEGVADDVYALLLLIGAISSLVLMVTTAIRVAKSTSLETPPIRLTIGKGLKDFPKASIDDKFEILMKMQSIVVHAGIRKTFLKLASQFIAEFEQRSAEEFITLFRQAEQDLRLQILLPRAFLEDFGLS